MLKVFFADDEREVLEGIKNIVDWNSIGYEICGEAMDGLSAYNSIKSLNPDLILLDIKMPKIEGIELTRLLREEGFKGHIIVLSGFSEFKYAQEAIRNGVDFYLTKPIDEDALSDAAVDIRKKILNSRMNHETQSYYKEKAKFKILEDILFNTELKDSPYSLKELNLEAERYQVLILDETTPARTGYSELITAMQLPHNTVFVDKFNHETYRIVLLKGESVINRFAQFQKANFDKNLAYTVSVGSIIDNIHEAHLSLEEAQRIHDRLFFIGGKYKVITSDMIRFIEPEVFYTVKESRVLGEQLYDLLVVYRKTECLSFLEDLLSKMMQSSNEAGDIRSVLAGMYIYLVSRLKTSYTSADLKFMTNAEIIKSLHNQRYLHDIIEFFKYEIHRIHQLIGGMSSDGILDGIIDYIQHNYHEDIKLKKLAPKFGYNSSYLGKIFAKKMDISFNDFLHKVRIEEAKNLLLNSTYKIYEIATLLGYKNVDYFHLRFKQFENTTPNEYRLSHHIEIKE